MDVVTFTLIGIGTGALYALVAQGLVLVYRSSGVINFAQGAIAMVGGYVYFELRLQHGWPVPIAVIVAVLLSAVIGALIQVGFLRSMKQASPLARVILTLGVLVTLESAAALRYQQSVRSVPSILPTRSVELIHGSHVGMDRMVIFGIGLAVTVALWAVYRFSHFGRVTSAVAENTRIASATGNSPDLIAAINWAAGGGLAGLAGVLIAPITGLDPTNLSLIVLPALAAALIGGFQSFPLAFAGGLVVGIAESLLTRYVSTPGWAQSAPFLIVIAVLVLQGRGLPLRSFVLDRLPSVGTGRVNPRFAIPAAAVSFILMATWFRGTWATDITVTLTIGIICLSVVVVTGYAGQVSLAQYVLGGVGAFSAAKIVSAYNWNFVYGILIALIVSMMAGFIVGLPALRARGINLAVATLGLAEVLYNVLLNNGNYTGGLTGITVSTPTFFGWNMNPLIYPQRYGIFCLAVLICLSLMVANLRRGVAGRRLLAVRSSERAAASLGVSVYGAKLSAFVTSAGLAAIGGTLFAFLQPAVLPSEFDVFSSINIVTAVVLGGIGSVPGAMVGALSIAGGVMTRIWQEVHIDLWLPLIGGISVLLVLRSGQDGLVDMNVELVRGILAKVRRSAVKSREADAVSAMALVDVEVNGSDGRTGQVESVLEVKALCVRYGSVEAVKNFDVRVVPGTVHGIIGPNGAGKTTLVDTVTGFVSPSGGTVEIDGIDITRWKPARRSQLGLRRSFQSVELFDDLSVQENIAVGCDPGQLRRYVLDLFRPGRLSLTQAALAAVGVFQLEADLSRDIKQLSFGRRRMVAIARAVASAPSILLLDEPAAGLDDQEATELASLIRVLAEKWRMAVLLVEHNLDMIMSVCDEVTVMAQGRVLACGTPDQIRRHPEVLSAYIGDELQDEKEVAEAQGGSGS